jgi:glycosyltransferase involved in cell wall biosynthesis
MQVAFDATVLHGRKSGIGYYCEEILRGMLALDHDTRFFIFSHQPLTLDIPHANGSIRYSPKPFCPVRAIYMHALLPGILDRERPDLCHYTNFLAPISERRPYVVTIHDMGLEALRGCHPLAKRIYTRNLVPRVARGARLIITNSEYSKWEIVRWLGIPEDRIRVTPLAASPEFRPGQLPSAPYNPYFLFVGNLEPRKNLNRLIDAYARLGDIGHELWIVGNSWYRAGDIRRQVQERGIESRVRFLGYVAREELPGLYGGATAFVYPSLLEGFGLPVVEAMACGAPVITSNNSALKEVAGDAAVLVDPFDIDNMADRLRELAESPDLRSTLAARGLRRAAEFSWENTAALTLDAYREAAGGGVPKSRLRCVSDRDIATAIRRTIDYAALFDYPLRPAEIHQRLFDVAVDRSTFDRVLQQQGLPRTGEFVTGDPERIAHRTTREAIADRAIEGARPGLRFLASIPFVRMLAFSGATAHRNMDTAEDLDLFVVVEDGKLWFAFLTAMLWAKARGLRRAFCLNYLISDSALPLFDHDVFTAQQMASIKPVYGKACYDQFIKANPFVRRHFPNFDSGIQRAVYPELASSWIKRWLEGGLRWGAVWLLERASQTLLGWHFRRKLRAIPRATACDVLIEPQRLKLHFNDHKNAVLKKM